MTIAISLASLSASADDIRYKYINLNVDVPGYTFFIPSSINDLGVISGTVFQCGDIYCGNDHVAVFWHGKVFVLQPGDGGPINNFGTIGGDIVVNEDPDNFQTQAALFWGPRRTLIPQQPGELYSFVKSLNNGNAAVVESGSNQGLAYLLYQRGRTRVLDFGGDNPPFFPYHNDILNDRGFIAGTKPGADGNLFHGGRGFRLNSSTGSMQVLDPVPPDTLSWGLAINSRGDVLGYSFVLGSPYHERVGIWDRAGRFKTYYDETLNTSGLVFNDRNEIVITYMTRLDGNSYFVPRPGIRLNLADLIENLPSGARLDFVQAINNRGDILGFGLTGNSFLLKRIRSKSDEQEASAASGTAQPAHSSPPQPRKPCVCDRLCEQQPSVPPPRASNCKQGLPGHGASIAEIASGNVSRRGTVHRGKAPVALTAFRRSLFGIDPGRGAAIAAGPVGGDRLEHVTLANMVAYLQKYPIFRLP